MAWVGLGSVTLSENWASFPVDVLDSETFRLTQNYTVHPYHTALLAAYSPLPTPGGRHSFRRVIPSTDPTIITLWIPPDFKEAGYLTRTIQAKYRMPEYSQLTWTLTLEAYYPD